MTMPYERTNAVIETRELLQMLASGRQSVIGARVRREAHACSGANHSTSTSACRLLHYPESGARSLNRASQVNSAFHRQRNASILRMLHPTAQFANHLVAIAYRSLNC